MSNFYTFLTWIWERQSGETEDIDVINNYVRRKELEYTSVPGDPFLFFEWFFKHQGWKRFIDYYLNLPSTFGSNLIKESYDAEKLQWTLEFYIHDQIKQQIVSFYQELTYLFISQLSESLNLLQQAKRETIGFAAKQKLVKEYMSNVMRTSLPNVEDFKGYEQYMPFVKDVYTEFIHSVKSKIPKARTPEKQSGQSHHKKFGIGPINGPILRRIYSYSCNDWTFIDKDKTTEAEFVGYFLSPDPTSHSIRIQTACRINILAYILSKMKELFPGITYEAIEESGVILKSSKGSLPVKARDISKALSVIRRNSLPDKPEIDTFFKGLQDIKHKR